MRKFACLIIFGLLLLPVAPGIADDDDERKADREFIGRVNDAIDLGALWVVGQQRENGSWPGREGPYPMGVTSLGLLTILKCDYPRKSTVVKNARRYLMERFDDQYPSGLKTYSVAILMMALEESHATRDPAPKKKETRYGNISRMRRVNLPNADFMWMTKCAKWMVRHQTDTIWRYPGGGIDLSNTQYALLGLAAARRCGVPVPVDTFVKAAKHLLDSQDKTGPEVRRIVHVDQGPGYARRYLTNTYDRARGWGYVPGRPATGSMTTAGVSSLAICRSELMSWAGYKGPFGERMERGIRDGLAWLTKNFTVKNNPPGGKGWHYYYLFGLERAGVLADVTFLGDHDWYREGAEYLLDRQHRAGFWPRGRRGGSFEDTCFALLFLRRATTPVRVPKAVTPAPTESK